MDNFVLKIITSTKNEFWKQNSNWSLTNGIHTEYISMSTAS